MAEPVQSQDDPDGIEQISDLPGSPGPLADSCGNPTNAELPEPQTPIFEGLYPVALPAVSLLGARNDLPNPYDTGTHWGSLPDGRVWGSTAGISRAPDGTIWAIDRCGQTGAGGASCLDSELDPILQFDQSGAVLQQFSKSLVVSPHKITVSPDGNVWVADNGQADEKGQVVLKFSPDGELLMTLGTPGVAGTEPSGFVRTWRTDSGLYVPNDSNEDTSLRESDTLDVDSQTNVVNIDGTETTTESVTFTSPTEVAVNRAGDIYVADGHVGGGGALGNARVLKFDLDGNLVHVWGRKGMGAGEFDVVHSIAVDSQGYVYVGDLQNNRIQIFDGDGHFFDVWYQFGRPSGIYIDENDIMYVADSESRDGRTNIGRAGLPTTGYGFNLGARRGIRIGSVKDGRVTTFIPDPCPYPYAGVSTLAEGVTTDNDGNVYAADYLGTVRKFKTLPMVARLRMDNDRQKAAQSIQVERAGLFTHVDLKVNRIGTPTGTFWMTLEADSGGAPSGTPLATSDKFYSHDLSTIASDIRFHFSDPATVATSTTYWMVLQGTATIDGSNYVRIYGDLTGGYANGTSSLYGISGWGNEASDYYMRPFVTVTSN